MYLFVDTEFTDFIDCELISLGLVSEDGKHELYFEVTDHAVEKQSEFVRAAIVPLLDNDKHGAPYREAAMILQEWIDRLPDEEVMIVADYHMDLHLMGDMLLEAGGSRKRVLAKSLDDAFRHVLHERGYHMPVQQQRAFMGLQLGIEEYFLEVDNRRHHALVDAKANRHAWLKGLKNAART